MRAIAATLHPVKGCRLFASTNTFRLASEPVWERPDNWVPGKKSHPVRSKLPKIKFLAKNPPALPEEDAKFRLVASTVIERPPRVMRDLLPWEKEFEEWKVANHNRGSRPLPDLLQSQFEKIYKPVELPEQYPPKVTADDLANNRKSLNRHLTTALYLIVKKNRADNAWQFPQTELQGKESLKGGARRILKTTLGEEVDFHQLGNAPIGHIKYRFPEGYSKEHLGAKVFYMHTLLTFGDITLPQDSPYVDYLWVDKYELKEYLNEQQWDIVKDMLTPMDRD